jgi:thiol-disulfide isomerase/thioredoxin
MGRLSIVTLFAGALAAGCDQNKPPTPTVGSRSEVVLAGSGAPAAPSTPAPSASASAAASAAPKPPRRICETELARPGRPLPKAAFATAAGTGIALPEAKLEVGANRWTWINFYAAWCGPCKEEIPRLQKWEQKLAAALRVRFISLDDDERQLGKFLDDQPAGGVKSSLWLKTGATRDGFLEGLKLRSTPTLPAHALVDPQGKVRCAFEGAVEDADYGQVESIVARR